TFSALRDSLTGHSKLLIYYIAKIFLPFNLCPLLSPKDANIIPGIIVIAILITACFFVKGKRNNGLIIMGILWYLLFLLPTLYVASSKYDFYAYGHRLYLPIIGFLVVL